MDQRTKGLKDLPLSLNPFAIFRHLKDLSQAKLSLAQTLIDI